MVVPIAAVWTLRGAGVITSGWIGAALGAALSLVAAFAARAAWKRRSAACDVPFGDLLLWGWVRRVRAERKLTDAAAVLSLNDGEDRAERGRVLKQVAAALEAHDPYLDGHSKRVARYAAITAKRMGLPEEVVARIRAAATIHDVGKLRVPNDVLRKPGDLSDAEFEEIKRHAVHGADMAACLGDRELTSIVRHHHERFDGGGYPDGLRGRWIPLGARIVAVADTFDALTSPRPYRPATSHKRALDVLVEEAGSQLDPAVVHAFLGYYRGTRGVALWGLSGIPVGRPRELVPLLVAVPVIGAIAAADVARLAHRDLVPVGSSTTARVALSAPTPQDPGRRAARDEAGQPSKRAVDPGSSSLPRSATEPATATSEQRGGRPSLRRPGGGRPRAGRPRPPSTPERRRPRAVTPPAVSTPRQRDRRPPAATPAPEPRPVPAPRPATGPPPTGSPVTPPESPPVVTPAPPPVVTPEPAPPPRTPTAPATKDDCKSGGYVNYGFPNQGSCVAAVNQSRQGPA